MYCKHCYRMMEDGTDICPACGKSQMEKVKKPMGKESRILLGIATWFGSMVVVGAIGTALKLPSSLYSVLVIVVPVLAAFKVAVPKKIKINASQKPISSKPIPIPDPAPKKVDPEQDQKVQAIVQSLHDGTFKETIQELYGEGCTDADNEPVVSESNTSSVVAKSHRVTGMQYYMDNILELAVENSDYDMSKKEIIDCGMEDEKIWKYEFYPSKTELVPEPNNPHDPNAIKVIVDGEHVGYIKKNSCAHLLKVISEGRLRGIDCEIGGGPYKMVFEEIDDDTYENVYKLQRDETNLFVHLTVYEEKA